MPEPLSRDQQIENLQAVARDLLEKREPTLQRPAPGSPQRGRLASLGAIGIAAAFLLGKLKILIPFLKFWPYMLLTIATYAQERGWAWACGFVLLMLVHEAGHFIEMRRQGIPAGAPVFIPFVGAVIAMRGMPRNAWVEARVGIAGPIFGTLAGLVLLPFVTTGGLLASLWKTNLVIQLFNLVPISPLDGGRVVGAVSRWLWIPGLLMGLFLLLVWRSPILILILILGTITFVKAVRHPVPGYYDIGPARRLAMAGLYVGLTGAILMTLLVTARIGRPSATALLGYGLASLLPQRRSRP